VLDLRCDDDLAPESGGTASPGLAPSPEAGDPDRGLEEGTGMRIVRRGIDRCQPGRRFALVLVFDALERPADHHVLFDRALEHLEPGGQVLVSLSGTPSPDDGFPVSVVRRLTREHLETILWDRFEEVTWFSQAQGHHAQDPADARRVVEGALPEAAFWLALGKGPKPQRSNPRVSIVIPVYNRADYTFRCLRALAEKTDGQSLSYEVVIVDNGSTDATADLLREVRGDVLVRRNRENLGFARACNQGALLARGDVVVFLNNDTEVHPGWLQAIVEELDSHPETGLAGGRLLYPDGTIQHAGVVIGRDLIPVHIHRGLPADHPATRERRAYPVVTAACAAVRRLEFYALGMFDEEFVNGHEDIDLCFRYRAAGSAVVYRPDCVVTHHESVSEGRMASRPHNLARTFRKWRDRFLIQDDFAYSFREAERARPERSITFAIKIGTPDRDQTGWGDIYFAECLAKALGRQGHRCLIHYLHEWGRPDLDADVVLHLKGLSEYWPKSYNLNLLWMLNHPDLHRPEELARYDAVLVASLPHAERLRRVLPVPVLPLLQATDPEHFRPHPEVPKEFDVVFVGNNNGQGRLGMRRIVADLLPTKLRLGVWGRGWEERLPPGVHQGEFVPWEDLPSVYASAHVVLNDHQPEMLAHGFVNNRTFDVLACGARLLSDHVKGMEDVLPAPSYRKRSDLRWKVKKLLEPDATEEERFLTLRSRVLEEFTFDRRAGEILAVVNRLTEAQERAEACRRRTPLVRKERAPLVSVLMSTYNRREFLPAAIESIRLQTHADWELILVNDGGVSVKDIVTDRRDPRIRLLELPEHKGKGSAINRGFEASRGEFIAYLDDDDIWYPEHLESLLLPLLTIPGIEMAYSDAYDVTLEEDGNDPVGYREVRREIRYQRQVTVHDLALANFIQGMSVVHSRRLFSQAGGMDEGLEVLIDWDLWRRLACFSYPYHVSRVTADHFLRKPTSTSGRGQITSLATLDPVRYLECRVSVLSKPLPLPPDSPVRLAQERERVRVAMLTCIAEGEKFERAGAMEEARHCYERARRLRPDGFAPYRKLGQLELRENRPEQAFEHFLTCLNGNSQEASDYLYAALICLSRGQGPEAISILDTLKRRRIAVNERSARLLEEYRSKALLLCGELAGGLTEPRSGVLRTRKRAASAGAVGGDRP
jgi:GT2 family glycosyltransferase